MFKKIMVCLDGSDIAEQILPYAVEVARCFGSRVVLFEVTVPPSAVVAPSLGYYHATPLEKVKRDGKEAETYLERVAQPLRKKGLKMDCVTMPGDPGKTIVSYADENEVDLIAISTHGRGGLGRLVFGSVADFVLKKSGLPILLKRPQETKK